MSKDWGHPLTATLAGSSIGLAKVITRHSHMSNLRRCCEYKVVPVTRIGFFMQGENERDLIRQDWIISGNPL